MNLKLLPILVLASLQLSVSAAPTPSLKATQPPSPVMKTSSPTSTVRIKKPSLKPKETKNYSGVLNSSFVTNAIDFEDGSRSDSLELVVVYNYQFEAFRFGSLFIFDHNIKKTESGNSDPQFTATFNPFNPKGRVPTMGYLIVNVPLSKESQKQDLQGGLGAGLKASINSELLVKGFSVSGSVSVVRNLHRFETSLSQKVNNAYNSTQKISLGYKIGDFELGTTFYNLNGVTYENNIKQRFVHIEELSYSPIESLSFSLGHSNAGPTLKPNQIDSNINLFNENTSQVYAGVTYAY